MRPRGETQRRYNEAIQSLSSKRMFDKQSKTSVQDTINRPMAVKRRLACPQTVLHLYDAIAFVRQQKQIPNIDRLANYMKRVHNLNPSDVERQLKFATSDGLITVKRTVGCKGSKVGVEQDGYRIPEGEIQRDSHDWYCFECHRGGEVILCTSCHRVFHLVCIKEDCNGKKFVCSVCCMLKDSDRMKFEKSDLNTLLGYTCIRLKEKTKELHRIPRPTEETWRHDYLIYEPMDLVTMEDKMKAAEYSCLEEFHCDTMQVVHNAVVYFGTHSPIADMARQMLRDCDYDLNEIKQCQSCYRMSNQKDMDRWFCHPCNPPHELVFAKQKGFPFWPAKVIKKENGMYDVRFFGVHHQRAKCDQNSVKPITSTLEQLGIKRSISLNRALDELKYHQSLVKGASGKCDIFTDKNHKISRSSDTRKRKTRRSLPRMKGKSNPSSAATKNSDSESRLQTRSCAVSAGEEKKCKADTVKSVVPGNKNVKSKSRPSTPTSSSFTSKDPPAKKRKLSKESRKLITSQEKVNNELSNDESPSSSSPKNASIEEVPTPEDHNVVSSSSQETSISRVSVATQTPKKLLVGLEAEVQGDCSTKEPKKLCDCSAKYSKIFKDFREHLKLEHKEDKTQALQELAEKIKKEVEEEKQKTMAIAMEKFHKDLAEVQRKTDEEHQLSHQQQIRKLMEQHQQEISETKKKQWCYNCEAEAIYHCCWNTSYCSVECQQVHWHKEHKRTCRRKR